MRALVQVAHDPDERARRGLRLGVIESTFEPLPIDAPVAREWGRLAVPFTVAGLEREHAPGPLAQSTGIT
jgi:hypothetical protein